MRFMMERYFADDGIEPLQSWLFALAAYNAGPARIQQLRSQADREGHDRNSWVDNVELIAENATANGFGARAQIHSCAAGRADGVLAFDPGPEEHLIEKMRRIGRMSTMMFGNSVFQRKKLRMKYRH